ncbi:MAG: cyclic nucleotide-binding domain-containing protein [Pseudomonadota bacterium]
MLADLAENELLRKFHPGWISWFSDYCTAINFEPGDYMIERGSAAAGMYILIDGRVTVQKTNGNPIATIRGGSVVGEMALVDGGSRSADVVAETHVSTLMITKNQVEAIGQTRPDIGLVIMTNLCSIISNRARHLHEMMG